MRIRVRLFAALREAAGRGEVSVDVPPGATAEDVWQELVREQPALAPRRKSLMASVNRQYASFDTPVAEGDEVVFIPPVSGGSHGDEKPRRPSAKVGDGEMGFSSPT